MLDIMKLYEFGKQDWHLSVWSSSVFQTLYGFILSMPRTFSATLRMYGVNKIASYRRIYKITQIIYCVTNTLQLPSFSPRSTYFFWMSWSSNFWMEVMLMPVISLMSAKVYLRRKWLRLSWRWNNNNSKKINSAVILVYCRIYNSQI